MAVLPLIGAGLGAIEGYRRSEGNLGAALLGAGLGAVTPAGLRMAGTALGGIPAIAGVAGRGAQALSGGARGVAQAASGLGREGFAGAARTAAATGAGGMRSLASRLTTPAAIGGLAAGTGVLLGVPGAVGGLAAGAAGPARSAAQLGAGTLGYQQPGAIDYNALGGGGAVPPVGTFGAGGTLSDPLNVLGRVGMAQRLETLKSAEAQRDALRLLLPEISQAAEFRSKQEFQRQLAAAGVRQNIVTAANMLERSQQAAQQMGLNAASQAGAALTQQYQYQ
jgi:hypothetical protein